MTAEVAVLNKGAVALAADSAVTISSGNQAKIYNTVNKIFEICEAQPIGVMIYGGLEFMGLPLEVLIKEYRRSLRGQPRFKTVKACADSFRAYLETVSFSPTDEAINVGRIIVPEIDELAKEAQQAILRNGAGRRILVSKFNSTLNGIVQRRIARMRDLPACESLKRPTERNIDAGQDWIESLIEEKLGAYKPAAETRANVRRLVRLILHRSELSAARTGVVIAGYGDEEICPTLIAHEMDGMVGGHLKFVETKVVDVGRNGTEADAIGFAQDDMIEQFLNGVNPDYEDFARQLWLETMDRLSHVVTNAAVTEDGVAAAIRATLRADIIPKLAEGVDAKIREYKERNARQSVVSMVQHMPKQELANLAAALVDLTSLKRRVSAVRETVGGEVDVAVISKSEGFVWVKRKHYFPAELNQRFANRHYSPDQRGGGR